MYLYFFSAKYTTGVYIKRFIHLSVKLMHNEFKITISDIKIQAHIALNKQTRFETISISKKRGRVF